MYLISNLLSQYRTLVLCWDTKKTGACQVVISTFGKNQKENMFCGKKEKATSLKLMAFV